MSERLHNGQSNPALDRIAGMLEEQIEECHAAAKAVFNYASHDAKNVDAQMVAMMSATRLMQATASAASALKRLYGSESRHTVTVAQQRVEEGGYPTPEILKTNSGMPA